LRLLVSVRNAAEAGAAIIGGAEIIDAKDPAATSSIAPVTAGVLREIREEVPATIKLSAALGDVARLDELASAYARITVPLAFVKLGFRGVQDPDQVAVLLADAVRRAALLPTRPAVIAVGYADASRVGAISPLDLPAIITDTGADGLLLDTACKDLGSTFQLVTTPFLEVLSHRCEAEELTLAVGGGLGREDVDRASAFGATIFGVRGAACDQGRNGTVREALVQDLAQAIRNERAKA
jgi:uncharacterized protein (UPF0264 family)